MEEWDQDKLESVVKQKHGAEKPANQTEIICKYFLEAVEKKQYGWCAGGGGGGAACASWAVCALGYPAAALPAAVQPAQVGSWCTMLAPKLGAGRAVPACHAHHLQLCSWSQCVQWLPTAWPAAPRFWQCPNGGKDCKYRHALPPGYVLRSQMKARSARPAAAGSSGPPRLPLCTAQACTSQSKRSKLSGSRRLRAIPPTLQGRKQPQAKQSQLLQELLEAELADRKPIEDEIEEERRKVDAHTPITLQVRLLWAPMSAVSASRQHHCSRLHDSAAAHAAHPTCHEPPRPPGHAGQGEVQARPATAARQRLLAALCIQQARTLQGCQSPTGLCKHVGLNNVCCQVFQRWRREQAGKRAQDREAAEAERRKKGQLTGREIFAEVRPA